MLVLSRKVNERIILGNNIRITAVSIRGNQVRLGFEAPPNVPIFRDELRHEGGLPVFPANAATAIPHPARHLIKSRPSGG